MGQMDISRYIQTDGRTHSCRQQAITFFFFTVILFLLNTVRIILMYQ